MRAETVAEALGQVVGTLLFPFPVMLVVGGIYNLIRRPRVSFWGAIFRWWVVLIAAVLLVFGLLSQVAGA